VARIKLAADPVEHLPVFFVFGIFESLQEFVVAPDAAAVFRRTGVFPMQANRILLFRGASFVQAVFSWVRSRDYQKNVSTTE
jgi:hypothetical protein